MTTLPPAAPSAFQPPASGTPRDMARAWAGAIGAASRNLLDFRSCEAAEATRARLRPTHPEPLSGLSRQRGASAHQELDTLLQDYLPLSRVIDRAQSLAEKTGLFSNHDKEVTELLLGRSVRLRDPGEQSPETRDLAQGALPAEWITPQEALESMRSRFASARDAVVSVHEAAVQAKSMGLSAEQLSDPLSALSAAAELEASRAAQAGQAEAFALKAQSAHAGIMALRAALARSAMAIEQCKSQILDYQPAKPSRQHQEVDYFEKWRSRVFEAERERPQAAAIGLDKLLEALDQALSRAQDDLRANRAPLDAIESAKAMFEAHRAKAKALRSRGAELGSFLMELETATYGALRQTPTDPALVAKLCPAYCAAVAALGS
jgi:hypothetical protein